MKKDIHPTYNPKTKISCACGTEFSAGSTKENLKVELCSGCHPFFTGKQKIIDTARRVEKFHERAAKKADASKSVSGKKAKKEKRAIKKSEKSAKTVK
ncbi:MAG: hypothetical protein ACD_76C00164G0002 [uncultured bacterium]|nr:MAG: hypothetical protein ACD_76C00164G0002 [uncultured bacterium]HBD04999.1 50S ribosomal protein L31 [Candidatus Uhrbacteria bacterium]